MGRIKEFMFTVADRLGVDIEEVTDENFQHELEKMQEVANLRKEDYTTFCIQTGAPCGFPCNGDCEKNGIKIEKNK
jgi:hypothetical protein